MATPEAKASITTNRKRSAPSEAEDTACQPAHKKRMLPAGEYCPVPQTTQEYLRDPDQTFALSRSQTLQLLSKASEQNEARKDLIQRQEGALMNAAQQTRLFAARTPPYAKKSRNMRKLSKFLKPHQLPEIRRFDSSSKKSAPYQTGMLIFKIRSMQITDIKKCWRNSPRIKLDPLEKVELLLKELMQQRWQNHCLTYELKQARSPSQASSPADDHDTNKMEWIPTPPETPSPQSSGSAGPKSLKDASDDTTSPSEAHSAPTQKDPHSSTARPVNHEAKKYGSQSESREARSDGIKTMETSGDHTDANAVRHRTIAKRQRRQQNAPGTLQRVRSGLLASKDTGRSILGSRRDKAKRASQIDQALRKEDEDNLLHFASAHDSQSLNKDEAAQMSSLQSAKDLEIAVSAGIFDDTIKNLQLVASRDNFRQGEYHKLKLNRFYKNAAQNEMALYIQRESGAIIECHVHPLQLRPENTSIHILPWSKVSNKTTEEVASMLGTWSLFAQLPEIQAEAAALFLSSDDLARFKERSFGDPNYSTEDFGLKRRLAEYWDRAVKALRRHDPFKTACRMWVAGCDSDNKVRCWPPTFKNIQDCTNSLQQSPDDMLNTLIEASKQRNKARDPHDGESEFEDADSQPTFLSDRHIAKSGEDSDEEL